MPESFGARLRQRREQQQIALATIADQTKIKLSLLESLERDDVSRWPTGLFRRAFIRAYAHAIGLEPDRVVREFLELFPDPTEAVTPLPSAASESEHGNGVHPPMRLRYAVRAIAGYVSTLRNGRADDAPLTIAPPVVVQAPREKIAVPLEPAAPVERLPAPVEPTPPSAPDLIEVAAICEDLSRLNDATDAAPVLQKISEMLDAVGVILWIWDPRAADLRAAVAHGYSDKVLAQLPRVKCDASNATAAAFRTSQPCIVKSSDRASGALVAPLLTPAGCAGVLAIELQHGNEQREPLRALATIFAAQLARVVAAPRQAQDAAIADVRLQIAN
jgi:transcriptional regulator with XRE-family HTH domain